MTAFRLGAALALLVAAPLPAQTSAPARFAAAADVQAQIAASGQGDEAGPGCSR